MLTPNDMDLRGGELLCTGGTGGNGQIGSYSSYYVQYMINTPPQQRRDGGKGRIALEDSNSVIPGVKDGTATLVPVPRGQGHLLGGPVRRDPVHRGGRPVMALTEAMFVGACRPPRSSWG